MRKRRYEDLSVSIEEHIAEKADELAAEGMPREEAERAARRAFGNVTRIRERSREAWQWPTVESVWADARFALRQLVKAPGFTVTAALTLGLGIAVNGTMFSMVSAFMMPRLPSPDAEKVVVVSAVNPDETFLPDASGVSAPNYMSIRGDTRVFAETAAVNDGIQGSLAGREQPEAIFYDTVTPNFFGMLGASPRMGRGFLAGEDEPGHDHVMVLSHGLWTRKFGSDPGIVGRTVRLNREDYVVVGVMGGDFRLLGFAAQLWTPLTLTAADAAPAARKIRDLNVFTRLAPGVTLEQARAEAKRLAQRAETDYPQLERRWGANARTLPDYLVYAFSIGKAMAIIMCVVGFVLLIACANVAGLLLTRAAGRQKEMAIRASLGASRARIVRQLLIEGLTVALIGGATGLGLTWAGIRLLRAGLTFNPAISDVPVALDGRVLVFASVVTLLSAVLSSLAPALKASRTEISANLKSEGRAATSGRGRSRLRAVLVGGEIAMALFLLIGSGLLINGVYGLEHQRLGFRRDHLLTAGLTLDKAKYGDPGKQLAFVRELLRQVKEIPGVEDAAVTSNLPASGGGGVPVSIQGQAELPAGDQHNALHVEATPEYFAAAGIPVLRGRTFTDADDGSAPRVVVVNQEFVNKYLGGGEAVGRQVRLETGDATAGWEQIVGVVADVKKFSEQTMTDPEVYEAFAQRPVDGFSVMLRGGAAPDSMIPGLRAAVARQDAELPLLNVMSMEAVIEFQRNGNPLFEKMLGVFAALALLLAAIGVYGLIAYSVRQRTQEIGIRLALGAKTADIWWMILREGVKITVIGSAIGLVLALPLSRLFDAMFEGIHFAAPAVFPAVLVVVGLVAMAATLGPARRASRVDPMTALRVE